MFHHIRTVGFAAVAAMVGAFAAMSPMEAVAAKDQAGATSALDPQFEAVRQKRLEDLFAQLKTAPDQAKANAIVARIWETWNTSGNIDVDTLLNQARLAVREGGVSEAYLALNRVIEIAPNFSEGWNRRATLHYMTGRYEESVRDIQKTLSLEPRHFGALAGLGMIYMARKNWKAALKAFETAAEVNPWLQNRKVLLPQLRKRAAGQPL